MYVPPWAIAVVGTLFTVLLTIVGFLVKMVWASTQKKHTELDKKIEKLEGAQAATDKRFLEQELAFSRQFVDQESWTRDYITVSNRLDGMHKKIDRVERSVDGRRPSSDMP